MYLGCEFRALKIFGFGNGDVDMDGEAGDVLYASYLSMARAGLASVEFWDPKSQKWGQPHCQARFAILKVCDPAMWILAVANPTKVLPGGERRLLQARLHGARSIRPHNQLGPVQDPDRGPRRYVILST